MSKKNIVDKTKKENGAVHVTFQNDDGHRVYEYRGAAARSIMRGKDPQGLTGGRMIEFRPKEQ